MADGNGPILIPPDVVAMVEAANPVRRKRIVVGFAGGGGSSIAIHQALGVHPDAALNHWPRAIAVHQVNFPDAEHHCADIFDTDCRSVCEGEAIGLLWLSPDCRHFSKAKGGAPVSERVRGLAWVAIPWAKLRRPDVIMLENVEEFLTWGPLIRAEDGTMRPDLARKGQTFARWKRRLEQCGYVVEWRILSAADYGAPTIRKRLFIIARCDGQPIVWPEATHAPRAKAAGLSRAPYRSAAEIIDWSRPCPSIFMSREEARALRIKRPLEEATLRRIAKGLLRYTIASADPFIVPITHQGSDRFRSVHDPLAVVTTAHRGEFAVVAPVITGTAYGDDRPGAGLRAWDTRDPFGVVTSSGDKALTSAYLVPHMSERAGQAPRSRSIEEPYPTTPQSGDLVSVHLSRQFGKSVGSDALDPTGAVTAGGGGKTGLVSASIIRTDMSSAKYAGVNDIEDPMRTNTSGGGIALAAAFMEQANTGMVGHDARSPLSTTTERGTQQRLIAAQVTALRGSGPGMGDPDEPMRASTAGGTHQALLETLIEADADLTKPFGPRGEELRAFLIKYYGTATETDVRDPLATATSKARFGLVVVKGVAYRIVDIGMRMLDPETELAAAMGVPKSYVLGHDLAGRKITKTDVTKMVGNMVSPPPARALVAANCGHLIEPLGVAA